MRKKKDVRIDISDGVKMIIGDDGSTALAQYVLTASGFVQETWINLFPDEAERVMLALLAHLPEPGDGRD